MKKLLLLIVTVTLSFANSLQNLADRLSSVEKATLLKEFSNSSNKLYSGSSYKLKKGWNSFTTPKDGINVVKTFHDASKIKYILTYYPKGKLWAIYSPHKSFNDMLFLKYLEPHITFFILAKKDTIVEIKSNKVDGICKSISENRKKYASVTDSGIQRDYRLSSDAKILLQSRYYSHHDRGIYNDTRVTLIYPRIESDTKKIFKYGPANPKIALKFPKAYEGKPFYVYDFKQTKCFMGYFPSERIPPFPMLKALK
ncbi:hypothetical protein MNB_SM-5-791 [hydrothermal vent metagenome]|uniref:Uncharacterized protein n=1 Tax=hydrothermal vent metagenome TaxID=652676 RepID=A0A1W1CBE8_9ZZZZ